MLLEFYSQECPGCAEMKPLVARLQVEEGVTIERHEALHDEENAEKMQQYDKGLCGGVPFFFNTETNDFICGAASYEQLKSWARGSTPDTPLSERNLCEVRTLSTYKVGMKVEEGGYYVCVPCGYKKFLKAGMRFPSCLQCMGAEKRKGMFKKLELWERVS